MLTVSDPDDEEKKEKEGNGQWEKERYMPAALPVVISCLVPHLAAWQTHRTAPAPFLSSPCMPEKAIVQFAFCCMLLGWWWIPLL